MRVNDNKPGSGLDTRPQHEVFPGGGIGSGGGGLALTYTLP